MKEGTKQKLQTFISMSKNAVAKQALQDFMKDSESLAALASKCEFHPMFHSLLNLQKNRLTYLAALGLPLDLYEPGNSEEGYLIDSALDETIDDIVDNLKSCSRER
jgi:glutathione peroxidase-family protein